MPDGQHIVAVITAGALSPSGFDKQTEEIRVVLGWFDELRRRVPVK
jgi:hypothetical protein